MILEPKKTSCSSSCASCSSAFAKAAADRRSFSGGWSCFLFVAALLLIPATLVAQRGAQGGEWRTWGGDLGVTRYAPLDQIDASNFSTLQVAWRFRTESLGSRPDFNLQTTPLMINGVLYATAGEHRNAVAMDARDRRTAVDASARRRQARAAVIATPVGPRRGLLDRRQGRRADLLRHHWLSAGRSRREDGPAAAGLRRQRRRRPEKGQRPGARPDRQAKSPGTARRSSRRTSCSWAPRTAPAPRRAATENAKGYIRGFDARTGKRLWIFHTIPQPGEFGNDTWLKDSWSYTGNTGVWTQLTVDEELGIAYLPVEIPTGDYFGGHRPGQQPVRREPRRGRPEDRQAASGTTSSSTTGSGTTTSRARRSSPTSPSTAGRSRRWRSRPSRAFSTCSIAQTGEPVWPIEERPVERGTVPGEWYAPTQPFPTKPPPFERQGFLEDYVIDFTPELKAEALKMLSQYKIGPIYTPPIARGEDGKDGLLVHPERRQLARRLLRSRHRHALRLLAHAAARAVAGERPEALGHELHQRRRRRRRRRRRSERSGTAAGQTAMGPHHRDRSEQGRDRRGRSRTAIHRTRSRTIRRSKGVTIPRTGDRAAPAAARAASGR